MKGSVQINARESILLSKERNQCCHGMKLWKKSLSNFGWMDFLQAILVGL
jgi:hypothetical protein